MKREYGIDLFRVLAALIVFMFHGKLRGMHNYGIFNNFISMGAMFMTAFFMLSAFSLYYIYSKTDFSLKGQIKKFYIKRAVSIYPIYWIWMLWVIITYKDSIVNKIVTFPINMLGLQSLWHKLYFRDEGGVWFVSCILFCYILFPFLCIVLKQLSVKGKLTLLVFFYIMSFYTQLFTKLTGWEGFCSNYADCIFRCFEFCVGGIWASILIDHKVINAKWLKNWWVFIIEGLTLILLVSLGISLEIGVGDYMLYNIISIPIYCLMFYTLLGIKVSAGCVKVIGYFSNISYAFYVMQTFAWTAMEFIVTKLGWKCNIVIIICSILVNVVIASFVTYGIHKPVTNWCRKRLV